MKTTVFSNLYSKQVYNLDSYGKLIKYFEHLIYFTQSTLSCNGIPCVAIEWNVSVILGKYQITIVFFKTNYGKNNANF